jgi:hypothetical protein
MVQASQMVPGRLGRGEAVRGLKILVIVMGMMLVAGVAILIVGIAARVSQTRPEVAPFVAPQLDMPAGARIEAIGVGSDRVALNIVLPDGNRQLLIIDLVSGRRIGMIPLRSVP